MYFKIILILAVCLYSVASFKKFSGKDIPKDYAIGPITFIEYIGNEKTYFLTSQDVLGILDAKTGALLLVYELDDDQRIIEHKGSRLVVIQKKRDLNVFVVREQTYIKLQYSQFLEKQDFKQIIAFKRLSLHDYILTDSFLLKAQNPLANNYPVKDELGEKYQIIQKKTDSNEIYYQLLHVVGKDFAMGLVTLKETKDKKEVCIKKFFTSKKEVQTICHSFDAKDKINYVGEIGPHIFVSLQRANLVFNNKFQLISESKFDQPIAFFDELNVLKNPNSQTNLKGNQLSSTKTFFNFDKPHDKNSIQIFQRYILVKKENTVLANIQKNSDEDPKAVWAYSRQRNSLEYDLIIQFKNGKVICYIINEKEKKSTLAWTFNVVTVDKTAKGEEQQAKQVDLQTEQKLIEDIQTGKSSDLQVAGKDENNQT